MWDMFQGDSHPWVVRREDVGVKCIAVEDEEGVLRPCYVNAKDIPDGPKAEMAVYLGSIRRDKRC